MKTMNVVRGFKALALSAVFSTVFFVGCEQPVSSVVGADDAVALSYASKSSIDAILGGEAKPLDFGRIFGQLNLTGDQRGQIEQLRKQQMDCEKTAMDALKASERAIMESFKAQRQAIEAGVKAGTITKDDARAQMKAIEAAQKAALDANPARATADAARKACMDTFIAGVRAILTAEQLVKFDAWLANPTTGGGGKDGGPVGGGDKDRDTTGGKGGGPVGGGDKDRDTTGGKGGGPIGGGKVGGPVKDKGDIFKKLNLTAEQQAQLEILKKAHKDCEDPILAALKASEQAIAESFRAERQAIEAGVKAGTITKDQARTQMQDVEKRQKAAMDANRATYQAALKGCADTFNSGVRALLTPEQQAIWDSFLASNPVGKDDGRKDDGKGRKSHR